MIDFEIQKDGCILLKKDGVQMKLSASDLEYVHAEYEHRGIFRDEVLDYLKKEVKMGQLPEDALTNEGFIEAVLHEYERLKGDTLSEVKVKLDIAICEVDYQDYAA